MIGLWILALGCIVGIVVMMDYLKERKKRNGKTRYRNSEGFDDPTACGAINRADREIDYRRFKKTMRDLHNICAMNGFAIQGRVVLQDKTNGKVWR